MSFTKSILGAGLLLALAAPSEALARGFGTAARGGVAVGRGGGVAAGGSRAGAVSGPYGAHAGAARGGTYVGPGGTTVQAGRVGGATVGPRGGVHAGGASAARVTTPGGRTYTTGSRGGASVGPHGGVHAHGASGAAVRGPYGASAVGYRGGAAIGPYGGAVGGARTVGVAHGTRYVSPVAVRSQATYVRTASYGRTFTPGWYGVHTTAWRPIRWTAPSIWVAPAWPSVATYCGIVGPPIVYDYGSTVVIDNNSVYVNGTRTAPAPQYAEQAVVFAERGRDAKVVEADDWQPLGVFGMIQAEEKVAQNIFQIAVNKAGILRGNYYNAVADETKPIYGSVDRKSQRAAWSIGDKKTVVFEAGLNNLTGQQTTLLVHYGKERTQQMLLVRLPEGKDGK